MALDKWKVRVNDMEFSVGGETLRSAFNIAVTAFNEEAPRKEKILTVTIEHRGLVDWPQLTGCVCDQPEDRCRF